MEVFIGTPHQKRFLAQKLSLSRLFYTDRLNEINNNINYSSLHELIRTKEIDKLINFELFKKGIEIFLRSQQLLNINFIAIPFERVFIGLNKKKILATEKDFGGYYSSHQTYYHIEQISLTSIIGCYAANIYNKELTTLELLRSYIHDSIHFNTFRSYKLIDTFGTDLIGAKIHRFQYGFNFRNENGNSFSNPDNKGAATTRNLNLIMEGLTDDFSKSILLKIVTETKVDTTIFNKFEKNLYNEMTSPRFKAVFIDNDFTKQESNYLNTINKAYKSVWFLYYQFLDDFSLESKKKHKVFIFKSMINGQHSKVRKFFNTLSNNSNGFDIIFKSIHY